MKYRLAFLLVLLQSVSFCQAVTEKPVYTFIKNEGQILDQNGKLNQSILFIHSNRKGINTQLHQNGISYDLYHRAENDVTSSYIFDRIDIEFLGMNKGVEILPQEQLSGITNYYRSTQNSKSVSEVHQFGSVMYRNVYPNIDVIFKCDDKTGIMKYDFVLHPGANIDNIKLRYKGHEDLKIDKGNICISAGDKQFTETIPLSWYQEDGKEVQINFKLINRSTDFTDIGYQSENPLIIDQTLIIDPIPQLIWAKYIGDSLITTTKGIITDRFGYVYICGSTQSMNTIATIGAYQTVLTDSISDAYVSKYNNYGSLIWSTYFGGNLEDVANDVYVDTLFNVFLAGTTFSTVGITDSTALQDSLAGSSDAFLAKFNSIGQLQWSTYIGGDSTDVGIKLTTDYLQNVYLGGNTNSISGIATDSTYQSNLSGAMDGFVSKFDANGNLIWSTYLGGQDVESLSGISFGDTSIYVCGQTYSTDFTMSGPFSQDTLKGINDGFILHLDPDGNFIWSTYYGGEKEDAVNGVKVFNNNIYFTGTTNSDSLISTLGAYQVLKADSTDAFIGKMNNAGALIWGTYFGGDSIDTGIDLFFELDSNLFVFGATNSSNIQLDTAAAYQPELGGLNDSYISKFDRDGVNLWATYYGGPENEIPEAIAVYGNTGIYVVGSTKSDTAIVPISQQWSTNIYNSEQEGFFTKFVQGKSTAAGGICTGGGGGGGGGNGSIQEPDPILIHCPGIIEMLTVQGGDLGTDAEWIWYEGTCGNGPTLGVGDTIYVSPTQSTVYYVRAESITNATDCASIIVYVTSVIPISITSDSTVCIESDYTLSASGIGTFQWTGPNGFTCNTADTTFTVSDSSYQGWYFLDYADTNGCQQEDSLFLYVYGNPAYLSSVQQISCFNYNNGSIVIQSTENLNYNWNVPVVDSSNLTNLIPGIYYLNAVNEFNCSVSDTFEISEPPSFLLDTLIQETLCLDSSGMIILYLNPNEGPFSINWNPTGSLNDTISDLAYGNYDVTITSVNTCVENYSFFISNDNGLSVEITAVENITCEGFSDGYATANGIGGNPGYTYEWLPGGQTSQSVSDLDTGVYIVTVFDQDGCSSFDTVIINLNSNLDIDSLIISSLCSMSNGSIQLSVSNQGSLLSISWSNGIQGTLTADELSSGEYQVQLVDTFGCLYVYNFYVPPINDLDVIIIPGDTVINFGDEISLSAITNYMDDFNYLWSPDATLNCSICPTVTSNSTSTQIYQVIVNDENGCIDTAFVTIKINSPCIDLFIPSLFSPNNDGLNDKWDIIGTCFQSIKTIVFNQWGEIIFESFDQLISWEGNFKDVRVANDQYAYIIEVVYTNGTIETRNGSIRVMY